MKDLKEYDHFNPACHLAPVGSPLVIQLSVEAAGQFMGQARPVAVLAWRTGHISDRSDDMQYRLQNGMVIRGRYPWTHA